MRVLTTLALAGLVVLPLLAASPASAWCRMTTSNRVATSEQPCVEPDPTTDPPERYLEWHQRCTSVALSVAREGLLSTDLDEATIRAVLSRSLRTWEAVECEGGGSPGVEIELLSELATCSAPLYRDGGGNANTVLFVDDWPNRDYDPTAFAVTTVWHRRSTGQILDVDMEINERRGPYGVCPDEGCTDTRLVDLENVLTHEMGHYLGLAHSSDRDATMFASAAAGEVSKRELAPDDILGLCAAYPPGTLPPECDPTPMGGLRLDCDEDGGCSVSAPGSAGSRLGGLLLLGLALIVRARRRSR